MTTQIKFNTRHGLTVGSTPFSVLDSVGNATFNTITAGLWNGTIISGTYGGTGVNNGTKTITLGGNLVTSGAFDTTLTVGATTNVTLPTSGTLATTGNLSQFASTTSAQLKGIISDETGADGSALVFAGSPTLSTVTINGSDSLPAINVLGGTVTTSQPGINITQTWNNAGVAFSGIKCTITNTASASNAKVIDITVGNNKFGVDLTGAITQILSNPNLARDIVGFTGSRHVREYQDLNDWNTAQGIGGATTNTENFEWGFAWNAKWDTSSSSYLKDRSNANDHAVMFRIDKKFRNQWWFSDGTTPGSVISWVKKVDFDFPNNTLTTSLGATFTNGLTSTVGTTSLGVTSTGNLTVNGNFTVNGTTTILNTSEINVDDINITLGSVTTPTDTTANGGGITLLGSTNKTIEWNQGTTNWDSSENLNVATGKSFRVNNNIVLNQTTLGSTVLASSLTSVGALSSGSITSGFGGITGTTINSTPIGSTTPAAGAFTTVTTPFLVSSTDVVDVSRTHASTTAQIGIFDIRAICTGDMVDGYGAQQRFIIRDNAGVNNLIASISGVRKGADNTGALLVNVGAGAGTQAAEFSSTGLAVTGTLNATGQCTFTNINSGSSGTPLVIGNGAVQTLNVSSTGLTVTGTISGTSIQSTPIGTVTPAAGAFTTLSASGLMTTGSGATTAVGWQIGYSNSSGWAGLWSTANSIGMSTTYVLANDAGTGNTLLNSVGASSTCSIVCNGATKGAFTSTGLAVTGTISGTSIQNTPIGSTTPAAGAFTTLSASGETTLGGSAQQVIINRLSDATAYGAISFNAVTTTAGIAGVFGRGSGGDSGRLFYNVPSGQLHSIQVNATTVAEYSSTGLAVTGTISGTSIQNTPIGSTTASTGAFTTLSAAGNITISGANSLKGSHGAGGITSNFAAGDGVLSSNTTGVNNTAVGLNTLNANSTGYGNTANGVGALQPNTIGYYNTAVGLYALGSNTTGFENTAIGVSALTFNTTGYDNTAVGFQTLHLNTTGFYNTAFGLQALRSNTTGSQNTSVGVSSLYYNTTGTNNTAVGFASLQSNTTGVSNTVIGEIALFSNTTGSYNVASGHRTLYSNTTGSNNTASGADALYLNSTGYGNTAYGRDALFSNNTGYYNTASGQASLVSNTTGNNNTASGMNALYANTTGYQNTASGANALHSNTTGIYNTSSGVWALYSNTTGSYNVACGGGALYSNTTGSYNVACGKDALTNNTGSGNISIGEHAASGAHAPVFNITSHNNYVSFGHSNVTNAYINVAWTVVSDERDKMNFAPVQHGLSFVQQLSPIAYQFQTERGSNIPNGHVRYGFKAQDILALEGNNPVIIDNTNPEKLYYNGESLVPVLVKAIQELKAEFDAYKSTHP